MKRLKYLIGFSVLLVLMGINFSGCSGKASATQIGPNTYVMEAWSYNAAANVCRRQGLQFKLLRDRKTNYGARRLDFKCLSYHGEEYQKNSQYEVDADVSIKVDKKVEYK